jgi:hypothetical protein
VHHELLPVCIDETTVMNSKERGYLALAYNEVRIVDTLTNAEKISNSPSSSLVAFSDVQIDLDNMPG